MIALLLLSHALAQSPPTAPAPPDQEAADTRARELFENGRSLYDEGRYEEAAVAWEEAWELSERPLLLFNLANAYERTARWGEALERLQLYRAFAAAGEAERIEARIRNLELRVADERSAEAERAQQDALRAAEEAARLMEQATTEAEHTRLEAELDAERLRAAQAEQAARDAEKPGIPWPAVGIGAVGVGGLAVGTVGVLRARGARSTLDGLCVDSGGQILCKDGADAELSRERSGRFLAVTGYGVGLAGVAATVLLVRSDAGWVAPTPGGGWVVGVSHAF